MKPQAAPLQAFFSLPSSFRLHPSKALIPPIPMKTKINSRSISNLRHPSPFRRIPMCSLLPAPHVAPFDSFARATFNTARKATLSLYSLALLLAGAMAVHGQSALDGFDPNANGAVRAVVVQADGKILLGGDSQPSPPTAEGRLRLTTSPG
jgi:hypothetical protein